MKFSYLYIFNYHEKVCPKYLSNKRFFGYNINICYNLSICFSYKVILLSLISKKNIVYYNIKVVALLIIFYQYLIILRSSY